MSRRRKISVVAGIVLGVALLIPVIHHYQLRFALAAYVAEFKAKGEPMDLAQVIPPPVPPEQNGVPFITNALANFYGGIFSSNLTHNLPPAMREVSSGKAMIGWQQPKIIGSDEPSELLTNTWEDLGKELIAAKSDLDSFQNLTNHKLLDFNLDYQQGFNIRLAHLAQLKRAAQWLNASTLYNLHERKTSDACADVCAMLAIAKGQKEERLEISQLVRMNIARFSTAATWEILQDPNISENDLILLQQNWQSLEFISPIEQAYLMERVMDLCSMEQFQQNPDDLWRGVSGRSDGIQRMWHKGQWRWFWSYADERRALETQSMLIEATRMAETNNSFQSVQSFVRTNFVRLHFETPQPQDDTFQMDIDEFGVRWLFSEGAYDSFSMLRGAVIMETARNVVVTAIAIKRYELRHHQLPATLEELTPEFLPSVPIDCMDGQPLRYRPNADGTFLLYSVGENGVDDGGNPALEKGVIGSNYYWQNSHALDWVWPKPATEAEIQAYYQKISAQKN
jgi:hypothetical protein